MSERRFLIVSGLSGAGKTSALHALEDAGYYCVDNLPIDFLSDFVSFIAGGGMPQYESIAVGIDARNPASDLERFPAILDTLAAIELELDLIYIEANDATLIERFSETRRKHPLSSGDLSLSEAIAMERKLLEPISARSEMHIDTTKTKIHEFRAQIREQVARRRVGEISIQVRSFGYKNGVPPDADFVFDVRCLPNPHWDPDLRDLTGRDVLVRDFLERHIAVEQMVGDIILFLDTWIPRFEAENRSYLTVALGCTGGRHRSVYVAERLAAHFAGAQKRVMVNHRDS